MDYISLIVTILALIIAAISYFSGKRIKKLILGEKDMLADKVSDFKTTFKRHADKVYNDRETFNDSSRNTIEIRIEDLEGIIRNLNRFENNLRNINK